MVCWSAYQLVNLRLFRISVFHQPSGVAYAYMLIFKLTIFCWVDKMSCVHVVSFYNLIGTARARWKLTAFPANVTRLSPPPCFWESLVTRLGRKRRERNEYVYVYSRKSLRSYSNIQLSNTQNNKISLCLNRLCIHWFEHISYTWVNKRTCLFLKLQEMCA